MTAFSISHAVGRIPWIYIHNIDPQAGTTHPIVRSRLTSCLTKHTEHNRHSIVWSKIKPTLVIKHIIKFSRPINLIDRLGGTKWKPVTHYCAHTRFRSRQETEHVTTVRYRPVVPCVRIRRCAAPLQVVIDRLPVGFGVQEAVVHRGRLVRHRLLPC